MLALADKPLADQPDVCEQLDELARRAGTDGLKEFERRPYESRAKYLKRLFSEGNVMFICRDFEAVSGRTADLLYTVRRSRRQFALAVKRGGGLDGAVVELKETETALCH